MKAGPLTFRCEACQTPYNVLINAETSSVDGECHVILHITDDDLALFLIWCDSHRGPIGGVASRS